ncbi:MAG TPA: NADH-quinone oxidoreductase subunit J [Beutenbergiaceae bacterium]|nr:NADH-quinone oxidoreductase subunit J [Beutenbergiaceae bacterium]
MNEAITVSAGEEVLFWILAPLMVLGALMLIFGRRTIHIAVSVAGVMIGLAVMYIANEAMFLGIAQIVVYTGAVMMLFLFVIMLVGVDASESMSETLAGQRVWAVLAGLGTALLIGTVVTRANLPEPAGLEALNADTNPVGVARIIFSDFVFPLELTGALLITAALGAITLTHRLRLSPKIGQAERAEMKLKAFGEGADSSVVTGYPGPGVYARHNSADMPGIDPYGTPVMGTVASVLRVRGQDLTPPSRLILGRDDEAGNELDTDGALAGHGLDTEAPATEPSDEEDDE